MTLLYIVGAIAVLFTATLIVAQWRSSPGPMLSSDQEIAQAAREGRMSLAVKSYRELHGVGLKRAKEAVNALASGSSKAF
jgi:hypothetical protein